MVAWHEHGARWKKQCHDSGLCTQCGNRPGNGQTLCDPCIEKTRETNCKSYRSAGRKRLEKMRAAGICFVCKGKTEGGKVRCPECSAKNAARVMAARREKRVKMKRHEHK